MRRSKGFTLIELLAVIVILAIIALIATPIILNIINDSREKSNQRSVEGLAKATETTIGEIMMDSDYTGSDIVCKLGSNISLNEISEQNKNNIDNDETYCWDIGNPKGTLKQVTYSGSRVKAGSITFDKDTGKVSIVDAQVGSSSKTYTTEGSDNAIAVIASKLDPSDDSTIFRDHYGNIRYRGGSPDNYVEFNDESWRIIGIVDGYVKLVRSEEIGSYSWNNTLLNDWSKASLQQYLNGDYYNEIGLNSLVNDDYKEMIHDTTWYLGGDNDYNNYENMTISDMHIMIDREKSNSIYVEDGIVRSTKFIGKIGLMYPSDVGYATDTNCNETFYGFSDSDLCFNNNWLLNKTDSIWLITPNNINEDCAIVVTNGGSLFDSGDMIDIEHIVLPVLNLKSNVKITGGTGTDTDPYTLSVR